ncbi:MAG TPA: glycoside hydrolase family 2 TIM barrel-domain containing protein [Acidothermaceae bacterium]|jgi:beta-galactosidase|nr:glycoside hydrolase family 2 TIM barrel-domain containing protein [Acidothermaceae bacterium]
MTIAERQSAGPDAPYGREPADDLTDGRGEFRGLPWSDPEITSVGREPSHSINHEDRLSLDGQWQFELLQHPNQFPAGPLRSITVPGAWTMQETGDLPIYLDARMPFSEAPPHVPAANPTGYYRRSVVIPEAWSTRRIVLHVGAAESVLMVSFNGKSVGISKDSHLAAEFDVTSTANVGDNLLELMVVKWSDASFIEDQDQWWHGGLTRSVYLYSTPLVFLRDVAIVADFDVHSSTGALEISATIGTRSGAIPSGLSVRAQLGGKDICEPIPLTTQPRRREVGAAVPADGAAGFSAWSVLGMAAAGVELQKGDRQLATQMQRLIFPDAIGHAKASADVGHVAPWSAEMPRLHDLLVELVDEHGATIDSARWRVGFRRVEIKGRDLLVNGRRIWIHGVNRHDFDPLTGRTLTELQLREQLAQLKRFNINAIRTSHYPNDPAFLDIADEFGFYVVDEADIESHGWYGSICDDPRYRSAFVDRVARMVERDRNHPSIIMWSLGNESGSGVNHDAAAAWARGSDPSRPVHYEGAIAKDWYSGHRQTDVVCPMYPAIDALLAYAADPRADRPLIMCEYQHAMGNSNGGLDDYWSAIRRTPGLQGGFIWELWDHGLDPDNDGRYRYGGDFGELDHDGNFCIDGLLFPDGTPHPAMYELRRIFSPVEIPSTAEEVRRGSLRIHNTQCFAHLESLRLELFVVTATDATAVGTLDLTTGPGDTTVVELADEIVHALRDPRVLALRVRVVNRDALPWALAGAELAQLQVIVRHHAELLPARASGPVTVGLDGLAIHPAFAVGPSLSLWRAPTDNDRSRFTTSDFQSSRLYNAPRELLSIDTDDDRWTVTVASRYRSAAGHPIHHTQVIRSADDGLIFEETVTVPPELNDIERVGVTFQTPPGFEDVEWVGDGPHECYADRRSSALLGRWMSTVRDMAVPYIRPQENGARTSTSRVELRSADDLMVIVADRPLQVSLGHYSDQDLAEVAHWWELQPSESTIVHLDVAHRGLGSASVGPDVDPRFRVRAGTYRWSWSVVHGRR